jgi:hypothetical protein
MRPRVQRAPGLRCANYIQKAAQGPAAIASLADCRDADPSCGSFTDMADAGTDQHVAGDELREGARVL